MTDILTLREQAIEMRLITQMDIMNKWLIDNSVSPRTYQLK